MVEEYGQAAALVRRALELLDRIEAPADIGAHLDLALSRLDELLSGAGAHSGKGGETVSR